jgi:peptide/nickel transport system substrate-binding protein
VRTSKGSKIAALGLGLALVAAACSSDSKGGTGTTAAPGTTGAPGTTVAPGTTTPGTTTAPVAGGTITYAAEQEYTSYNNGAADQGLVANLLVLNMVQPGPFIQQPDLTLKVFNDIATSVELTSQDPQVVTYKLNPAAVWSDGAPLDCKDFYLAWVANNGKAEKKNPDYTKPSQVDKDGNPITEMLPVFNTASTTGYENISKLECSADNKTVTTTYDTPYVDYQGLFGGMLPAHVIEKNTGVADITKATADELVKVGDFWNTKFVGFDPAIDVSGAWYVIDSFTPGETLVLKKNPKYWGKPGNADEIIFRQVPDATQQPAALENGDVQVISPQPNADLLKQLQAISGVSTEVNSGTTFEHYDFNMANEFLKDLKVRQAFALCIDRQQIVDTLVKTLNDKAEVLNNRIYIPQQPDYKDNSGDYGKKDIAKSKQLLTDAGFTFGADGIATKGGKKLTLRLGRRDPNARRQSTNELTIASCKEAGFDLKDDAAENFNAERLPASDYDIALFAWQNTGLLSSNTSLYVPGGGQNWNNYNNPKAKELMDAANKEFDAAKRADLMNQVDQLLWTDMVTLPLFQFQEAVAHTDTVTGVVYHGALGVTWNANDWAVKS